MARVPPGWGHTVFSIVFFGGSYEACAGQIYGFAALVVAATLLQVWSSRATNANGPRARRLAVLDAQLAGVVGLTVAIATFGFALRLGRMRNALEAMAFNRPDPEADWSIISGELEAFAVSRVVATAFVGASILVGAVLLWSNRRILKPWLRQRVAFAVVLLGGWSAVVGLSDGRHLTAGEQQSETSFVVDGWAKYEPPVKKFSYVASEPEVAANSPRLARVCSPSS